MTEAFLEMRDICKAYPGVRALDGVNLAVGAGEVRALVGENGAGKSTLIRILAGAATADSGEIYLGGQRAVYRDPIEAFALGIGAVYQEFNLVPQLNVAQNITLGQTPARGGRIDNRAIHRRAREVLDQLDVQLDTRLPVSELNVAQQQIVEIAKGLARDLRVLILDEPTAALNTIEAEHLFRVVKTLKQRGVSIIYITHRMREIFQIADSVTVLKDGQLVATRPAGELTSDEIVSMMIGRELSQYYPPRAETTGEVVYRARNLNLAHALFDISLDVHHGEVLGIAGLEGQGQRELMRALFGDLRCDSGQFERNGRIVKITSPSDAVAAGIAFVSDDRKADGLVLIRSVAENIALPSLRRRTVGALFVNEREERGFITRAIESLAVKVSSRFQAVESLSGGNQQKIVVAKWLGTEPEVLIVCEPTRGIDVGSKSEIHHIIRDLAQKGVAVIMASSELPEILGMSDRILVMAEGRIAGELAGAEATEETIMSIASRHSLAADAPVAPASA